MKRFAAIALTLLFLFMLVGCSENSSNQNSPTPKGSHTGTPLKITAQAQAEYELEKYIDQNVDANVEGAIVIIKNQGLFSSYHYSKNSGLHALYEDSIFSALPIGMNDVTPENSKEILRIFTYDMDLEKDYELINSMYSAINDRRYEDYANLFALNNYNFTSKKAFMAEIEDEQARAEQTGLYNIDQVSDIEVLAVMPLDSVYADLWQDSVLTVDSLTDIDVDPDLHYREYCYDVKRPMIYLVRNEYKMFNELSNDETLSSGTYYWIIVVGNDNGVRKIQGVWEPEAHTVSEYGTNTGA